MESELKKSKFEECLEKGELRKVPSSKQKSQRSVKTARKWLKEARTNFNNEAYKSCLLSSYIAMFHSARAILFFDGYREKSHYCVGRYLEEKYVKNDRLENKWVKLFDHYRELRHKDHYSLSFTATLKEAKKAVETAEEFVDRMDELLGEMM